MRQRLHSLARRFHAMFAVFYGVMLEYRAELALWAVATSIPLIMMGVWAQVAGSEGGGGLPLDEVTLVRYFVAVFIVRQLTIVWVIYDFEWHVVSGRLSPLLLQPANPHWRFVVAHFAEQGAKLPFTLVIIGLCFVLYPEALWGADGESWWRPGGWDVALMLLLCVWAFAVRYLIQNAVAILAFWVERVVSIEQIIYLPYLYLSGLLAPLELFPGWAREVALWTPLPYLVWLPAMLIADGVPPGDLPLVRAAITLAAWTVALAWLNRWLWSRGLKHYSAMGA